MPIVMARASSFFMATWVFLKLGRKRAMEIAYKGEVEGRHKVQGARHKVQGTSTRYKAQGAGHKEGPRFKAKKPGKDQAWNAF